MGFGIALERSEDSERRRCRARSFARREGASSSWVVGADLAVVGREEVSEVGGRED